MKRLSRKKQFSFPLWNSYFSGREQVILFILLLLGTTLRVINALFTQLWRDEVYILFTSRNNSLWKLMTQQHWDTAHPPLYFIFLHFWQMVSMQPFWLRLPSLIASFFILYLVPILAVKITRKYKFFPFIFLFLFSVSLTQMSLNTVVRPYPFAILFALVSLILFLTMLENEKKNTKTLPYFIVANTLAIFTDYSTIWLFLTYFVFFCIYYFYHKKSPHTRYVFRGLLFSAICASAVLPLLLGNLKNSLSLEKKLEPIKSSKVSIKQNLDLNIVIRRKEREVDVYDAQLNLVSRSPISSDPFPENKVYFGYNLAPFSLLNVNAFSFCAFDGEKQDVNINEISASCRFYDSVFSLKGNTIKKVSRLVAEFFDKNKSSLLNFKNGSWETPIYKKSIIISDNDDIFLKVNFSSYYLFSPAGINIYGGLQKEPIAWWKNVSRLTIYSSEGQYHILYYDGASPNEHYVVNNKGPLETLSGNLLFFTGIPGSLNTYIWLLAACVSLCISQLVLIYLFLSQKKEGYLLFSLLFTVPILISAIVSYFFVPIFLGRNLHLSNISFLCSLSIFIATLLSKKAPISQSILSKIMCGGILIFFLALLLIQYPSIQYVDPAYDTKSVVYFLNENKNRQIYVVVDNEDFYFPLIQYYLLLMRDHTDVHLIPLNGEHTLSDLIMAKAKMYPIYFLKFGDEQKQYGVAFKEPSQQLGCKLVERQINYVYFARCE